MKVYEDYQNNETLIANIKIIEKVGETLPFLLKDNTIRKDITYCCDKLKGEVVESFCSYLRKGDIKIFKKRKIFAVGLVSTTTVHKNPDAEYTLSLVDEFIKVNGIEIY